MKAFENIIPPPLVALLTGFLEWVLARTTTRLEFDPLLHYSPVVVFGVLAGVVGGMGVAAFRRAQTTINPVQIDQASSVVTGGVFRYTRNPMYVALTLLLLSWACFLAAPWALVGPLGFILFIQQFQIIPEERIMAEKFGAVYLDYKQQVRRWL